MILSITYQFKIFLISLCVGLILGFFYDLIKIFRRFVLHNNILINIEDAIYWVFMSVMVFFICLYQNNGEVRLFFIIGIFLSLILYNLLISSVFINIFTKIIKLLITVFLLFFKLIYTPILFTFKLILKPFEYLLKIFINFLKKLLKKSPFCVTIYSKIKNVKISIAKGVKKTNARFRK